MHTRPLAYFVFILFVVLLFLNQLITTEQHFIVLAKSFLKGSFAIVDTLENVSDFAYFNGRYFWPLGPFPAIILMPFVYAIEHFPQGYIQFPLNVLNFLLVYKIANHLNLSKEKSLVLASFYIFGSIYTPIGALPGSWFFAQVLATTLLLLALFEFVNKKRFLLIGTALALAAATRFTIFFGSIFFLIFLFQKPLNFKNMGKFLLPLIIVLVLLGFYNTRRFGTPFETGYNYQLIYSQSALRRDHGLFSPKHLPANLYYMLFNGPKPVIKEDSYILKFPFVTFDPYGLSIFFLSPILLLIFRANFKEKLVWVSAATILVMLIPLTTYYGIGYPQIGYRYALDFFPFLLISLISGIKRTPQINLYFLLLWGIFLSWYFTFQMLFGLYLT